MAVHKSQIVSILRFFREEIKRDCDGSIFYDMRVESTGKYVHTTNSTDVLYYIELTCGN